MRKFALALALVLLPASVHPNRAAFPERRFSPSGIRGEKREVRLDQQKSKWAPNGMKVLIIHGKRRWVVPFRNLPMEKSKSFPIPKEGV